MLTLTVETEYIWDGTNKDLYDVVQSQNNFIVELSNRLTIYFEDVTVKVGTQQRFISSDKLTGDDFVLIDTMIESVIDSNEWLVYK